MRYKSHLLFGSENDPVSVSLPPFFSDKRKTCRRQGETNDNKYQVDRMSEDEPSSPPIQSKLVQSLLISLYYYVGNGNESKREKA